MKYIKLMEHAGLPITKSRCRKCPDYYSARLYWGFIPIPFIKRTFCIYENKTLSNMRKIVYNLTEIKYITHCGDTNEHTETLTVNIEYGDK